MVDPDPTDVDLIEELRLRRWARENYVPSGRRQPDWHPIILDEMLRKDEEEAELAGALVELMR
jgi:hypothetical protein